MKLKYYLRGMGIGIILTAIVMGFALGGRKAALSDAEIIQRAKILGMVEGDTGPLSDTQKTETEGTKDDASAPGQALDKEGKEISEEEHQGVASPDTGLQEVASEKEEGEGADAEGQGSSDTSSAEVSEKATDAEAVGTTESTETAEAAKTETKTDASSELATDEEEEEPAQSAEEVNQQARTETPAADTSTGNGKTITIPGGMGSDQVAQILYNEGLIDNAANFNRYLIDSRQDRVIRSGTKVIPEGADYEQIASIITRG